MSSNIIGPQERSTPSMEKVLSEFDSIPLFMKSLPEEDTGDTALAALQSLVYDGTPDEVAHNFKEQGNDYFKGKRYREALGFYTQGVDAKPTDIALQEALLCNRAACNLELKNYGSVLKDCSKALTLNPKSSKAYYRSAVALLALDRVEDALDCCNRCLTYDADNKPMQALQDKVAKIKEAKDKKECERQERIRKEQEEKRIMSTAFRERNLINIPKPDGSSNPYAPHWDPEDSTRSTLILPVFFLYPQYATSDVISEFAEDTTFSAHISTMFPPETPPPDWDANHEYVDVKLVVYAITHRKRLLKIGKKMTLMDLFKASKAKEGDPKDGLEVKDGCLTFIVFPKGDVEKKWIDDFKKTRDS